MLRVSRLSVCVLAFALCLAAAISGAEPARHVLIFGIDGVWPDALKVANTPNLDRLIDSGTYASNTDIVAPRPTKSDTVSGPGWSNSLCGVWSDKHGLLDNDFKGANYVEYPHFFAHLEEAQSKAFTVSLSTSKPIDEKILSAADIHADYERKNKDYVASDRAVATQAIEVIEEHDPTAIVVDFV